MSPEAKSCTLRFHVPLGFWPSKNDSGYMGGGVQVPVNGACADVAVWIDGALASSSISTLQKLLPLPPVKMITGCVVPYGDVRLIERSPTNSWSMPTVVAPTVVVHAVPSMLRLTSVSPHPGH